MIDNVERADLIMERWLPALHDHGPCPNVYDFFVHLLSQKYSEVLGVVEEEMFFRRAVVIWHDEDWDLCHLIELRDLIAIDLDDLEECSMG